MTSDVTAVLPLVQAPTLINITDPDARNVKTSRGWVQGYNAQAVCTEQQIVIAAEVTVASPDFGHLEPMIAATETDFQKSLSVVTWTVSINSRSR